MKQDEESWLNHVDLSRLFSLPSVAPSSLSLHNQLQPMTDGRVRNGRINFFNIVSVMQAPLLPLVVRSSSFGGPSRFVVAV